MEQPQRQTLDCSDGVGVEFGAGPLVPRRTLVPALALVLESLGVGSEASDGSGIGAPNCKNVTVLTDI